MAPEGMNKWIFILIIFSSKLNQLSAQDAYDQKYFIGAYYAFFNTEVYPDGTNDSVSTEEHFIDVNFNTHSTRLGG